MRTVRALVTKKKRKKETKSNLGGKKINVRADRMLGKEYVRKALTFCTLHINNFQNDKNCKPQPHDPLNSRPLHSFLFLRTLLPIVELSIFLYLTETLHKTNDQKRKKRLYFWEAIVGLGGRRRRLGPPTLANKLPHNKAHRHSDYRATMTLSHVIIQLQTSRR